MVSPPCMSPQKVAWALRHALSYEKAGTERAIKRTKRTKQLDKAITMTVSEEEKEKKKMKWKLKFDECKQWYLQMREVLHGNAGNENDLRKKKKKNLILHIWSKIIIK